MVRADCLWFCGVLLCVGSGNVETMENRWGSPNRFAAFMTMDEEEEQIAPESPYRIVPEPFVRGTSSEKNMRKKRLCGGFKHQDSCSDECCENWIESVVSLAAGYSSKADAADVKSELVKIDVNAFTPY